MASKRKLIRDNVINVLKAISTAQGYNHTVKLVTDKRKAIETMRQDEFPCIFVAYGAPETSSFSTADGGYIDAALSFSLFCYLKVEKGKNESDEADGLVEDVKKALYADIFRGGNADTTLVSAVAVDAVSELPYVSIDIDVAVNYSHQRSVP